ncbi:hypothetical protein [Acinetobacter sp.]|uniref:hypothetical protein n=1 Tax=Acinetobacter sp. TaxID=472 RepID=UPI003890CD51
MTQHKNYKLPISRLDWSQKAFYIDIFYAEAKYESLKIYGTDHYQKDHLFLIYKRSLIKGITLPNYRTSAELKSTTIR